MHDHGTEVEVHLVPGGDEVVDGGDAVRDLGRPHVDQARRLLRHEAEPHPGPAPRVVVEQVAVDQLGGETGFGVGDSSEEIDEVADVVGHHRVRRAVAVLADVVDPVDRIALVGNEFGALALGVAFQVSGDLLDVREHRDRVGVTLASRHVAVRAGHRAAVGRRRCDPVARAFVAARREALLLAEDQHLALVADPVRGTALVAVEPGDRLVRQDLDALGVGEPIHHVACPREPLDVGFVIDPLDVDQPVGQVWRGAANRHVRGRGRHARFNARRWAGSSSRQRVMGPISPARGPRCRGRPAHRPRRRRYSHRSPRPRRPRPRRSSQERRHRR